MLAYFVYLCSLVYYYLFIISHVGLYFVSYNDPSVLFLLFFCNKFETWWLYKSLTVNSLEIAWM